MVYRFVPPLRRIYASLIITFRFQKGEETYLGDPGAHSGRNYEPQGMQEVPHGIYDGSQADVVANNELEYAVSLLAGHAGFDGELFHIAQYVMADHVL